MSMVMNHRSDDGVRCHGEKVKNERSEVKGKNSNARGHWAKVKSRMRLN